MQKINARPFVGIILLVALLNGALILGSFFLTARENGIKSVNFKRDFISFYLLPLQDLPLDKKDQFLQQKSYTCGPAALSYLLNLYGLSADENTLAKLANTDKRGTSLKGLIDCAKYYGFKAWGEQQNLQGLIDCPKPVIAHINNVHFVAVEKIVGDKIILFDPLMGRVRMDLLMFESIWSGYVAIIDVNEPVHNRKATK